METFTLKVIGFSRVFYEGEAVQVQLPIQDGSMGIMAHHEAAVIGIVPGTMRLQTPDGEWQSAVVDAGFAQGGREYRIGDGGRGAVGPRRSTRSASAGRWRRRRKSCARSAACWRARTLRLTVLRSLARLHAKGIFLS